MRAPGSARARVRGARRACGSRAQAALRGHRRRRGYGRGMLPANRGGHVVTTAVGALSAADCSSRSARGGRRRGPSRGGPPSRTGGFPTPAGGGGSAARVARAQRSVRRREWVQQVGSVEPSVPVWTSRRGWVSAVSAWAVGPGLREVREDTRVSISPATVVAVARLWARFADHGTGRNAAVTRARIAEELGCAIKTVQRAWQVLGVAGFAVEAARGHGSSSGHTAGNRPSVWHLISRRPERETASTPPSEPGSGDAGPVDNVPLPPSRRERWVSHLQKNSPNARKRAPKTKFPSKQSKQQGRRCAPRPLHLQKIAAGIVAGSQGLAHVHSGHICEALARSGLDLTDWTAPQILTALNADMNARGWSWPNRIDRPGAFLAARLRRLPVRPDGARRGGVTAAGLDKAAGRVESSAPISPPLRATDLEHQAQPATAATRAAAKAYFQQHRAKPGVS